MNRDKALYNTKDRKEAIAKLSAISPDFVELIAKFPISEVQERTVISSREKEIIAIVALINLGTERLRGHLESGLRAGISKSELAEIILQTSIYIGFPRAVDAMLLLSDISE